MIDDIALHISLRHQISKRTYKAPWLINMTTILSQNKLFRQVQTIVYFDCKHTKEEVLCTAVFPLNWFVIQSPRTLLCPLLLPTKRSLFKITFREHKTIVLVTSAQQVQQHSGFSIFNYCHSCDQLYYIILYLPIYYLPIYCPPIYYLL